MRRGADPEASAALEALDAKRASERAQLAAKPRHGWLEAEKYKQITMHEVAPIKQRRRLPR